MTEIALRESGQGITLTPPEAQVYCSLDLEKNLDAARHQRKASRSLAEIFANGEKVSPDDWISNDYLTQAKKPLKKLPEIKYELIPQDDAPTPSKVLTETKQPNIPAAPAKKPSIDSKYDPIIIHHTRNIPTSNANEENLTKEKSRSEKLKDFFYDIFIRSSMRFWLLGRFTTTRLALSRLNRTLIFNKSDVKNDVYISRLGGTNSLLAIGGLSYGIELLFDIFLVLKHVFFPHKGEENLTIGQRFHNALNKKDRKARMWNAAIWFGINLACLFITGGTSALLNIAAFTFDVAHEIYKQRRDLKQHRKVLKKVDDEIRNLEAELKNVYLKNYQQKDYAVKCENTFQELQRLKFVRTQLLKKIEAVREEGAFSIRVAIGILVGFTTIFFPQLFLILAAAGLLSGAATYKDWDTKKKILVVLGAAAAALSFVFPPATLAITAVSALGAIIMLTTGSIYGGFGNWIRRSWFGKQCGELYDSIKNSWFGEQCGKVFNPISNACSHTWNNFNDWISYNWLSKQCSKLWKATSNLCRNAWQRTTGNAAGTIDDVELPLIQTPQSRASAVVPAALAVSAATVAAPAQPPLAENAPIADVAVKPAAIPAQTPLSEKKSVAATKSDNYFPNDLSTASTLLASPNSTRLITLLTSAKPFPTATNVASALAKSTSAPALAPGDQKGLSNSSSSSMILPGKANLAAYIASPTQTTMTTPLSTLSQRKRSDSDISLDGEEFLPPNTTPMDSTTIALRT